VAKPIGSRCNLNCTYCYYLAKDDLVPTLAAGRIDDDLLEAFLRQYIEAQEVDPVRFNWHGGEPALLGLDFYRKIIELEAKHANGKRIENEFQTNGVLLDESWCEFFKAHDFLVGLSLDGPKHLHDRFRVNKGGEPTFDQVYRAARLLQQHEVRFNILAVINAVNVKHPHEVYRFFTEELSCRRLQWLPCVERKDSRTTAPASWNPAEMPILGTEAAQPGHPTSVVTDWSVDPYDWGNFLCQTFYLWAQKDIGKVLVNWFESLARQWLGQPALLCNLAEVCGRSLVALEKDGSLYSCERFVYPEYRLGNLRTLDRPLIDVVYSPRQVEFGCNKRNSLPDYCRQCTYHFACHGECPKNRFVKTPDGQPGLNYLCPGNRHFFAYANPILRQIIAQLRAAGAQAMTGLDEQHR
jgi:uncharacterized protein